MNKRQANVLIKPEYPYKPNSLLTVKSLAPQMQTSFIQSNIHVDTPITLPSIPIKETIEKKSIESFKPTFSFRPLQIFSDKNIPTQPMPISITNTPTHIITENIQTESVNNNQIVPIQLESHQSNLQTQNSNSQTSAETTHVKPNIQQTIPVIESNVKSIISPMFTNPILKSFNTQSSNLNTFMQQPAPIQTSQFNPIQNGFLDQISTAQMTGQTNLVQNQMPHISNQIGSPDKMTNSQPFFMQNQINMGSPATNQFGQSAQSEFGQTGMSQMSMGVNGQQGNMIINPTSPIINNQFGTNIGMGQTGMGQMGLGQMGMGHMGMGQMGMGQIGMGQIGMSQMGMGQMGMNQMGMGQMGLGQMRSNGHSGMGLINPMPPIISNQFGTSQMNTGQPGVMFNQFGTNMGMSQMSGNPSFSMGLQKLMVNKIIFIK